jgi:NAD(P)-dependent dehydrogenase (short-subunit alcohol dehydrogenase family)
VLAGDIHTRAGRANHNKRIRALHPLGRFGTPREVFEAVLGLAGDKRRTHP